MTEEQEIEEAIRAGVHPVFLYGLVYLASTGSADLLMKLINRVGRRLYREKEHA